MSDFERVQLAIDQHVRPQVQLDGGDLKLISFTDGIVTIEFQGACIGCPFSLYTLVYGIQETLQKHIPEIKKVVAQ